MAMFDYGGPGSQYRNAVIQSLMAQGARPANNVGQGLASAGNSILSALLMRKQMGEESARADSAFAAMQDAIGADPSLANDPFVSRLMQNPDIGKQVAPQIMGQMLQNRFAAPDLPTGMRMGPSGPEYIPEYLEGQLRLRSAGRTSINNVVNAGTPGQDKLDESFAGDLAGVISEGGFADAEKQVDQLRSARDALAAVVEGRANKNLTGPVIGSIPDSVLSFTNPDAIATRERVEEVVQRNLRQVLGAQFTDKEGERLISRAFNPRLSEAENLRRVDALLGAVERGLEERKQAARYFQENGTLRGYNGRSVTVPDIDAALDAASSVGSSNAQQPPNGVDPELWELMTDEEKALWQN